MNLKTVYYVLLYDIISNSSWRHKNNIQSPKILHSHVCLSSVPCPVCCDVKDSTQASLGNYKISPFDTFKSLQICMDVLVNSAYSFQAYMHIYIYIYIYMNDIQLVMQSVRQQCASLWESHSSLPWASAVRHMEMMNLDCPCASLFFSVFRLHSSLVLFHCLPFLLLNLLF